MVKKEMLSKTERAYYKEDTNHYLPKIKQEDRKLLEKVVADYGQNKQQQEISHEQ